MIFLNLIDGNGTFNSSFWAKYPLALGIGIHIADMVFLHFPAIFAQWSRGEWFQRRQSVVIRFEVIIQGTSPRAHKPLRRDIDRVGRTLAPKKESKES